MQPLGGAAAEPLFRQAADVAANQAIAAGFGRSGAQVIGTRQALNDIILRDLRQRRQLAGLTLGVPGAIETGLTAGGGILSQLGGLLGGGKGGIFGGGGGGLLGKAGGLLRGGLSKLGGLLGGGGATASTLSAGGLAGLPTAGTTLGGLFGGTAAGGTTLAAPGAFGGATALTGGGVAGAGGGGALSGLGAAGVGAAGLAIPAIVGLISGIGRKKRRAGRQAVLREALGRFNQALETRDFTNVTPSELQIILTSGLQRERLQAKGLLDAAIQRAGGDPLIKIFAREQAARDAP